MGYANVWMVGEARLVTNPIVPLIAVVTVNALLLVFATVHRLTLELLAMFCIVHSMVKRNAMDGVLASKLSVFARKDGQVLIVVNQFVQAHVPTTGLAPILVPVLAAMDTLDNRASSRNATTIARSMENVHSTVLANALLVTLEMIALKSFALNLA